MLITSIVIFALAAVFGLLNLAKVLGEKPTQKPMVFIHGILAAAALVILLVFATGTRGQSPIASIVLFLVAAVGGFILFARDMSKKPGPKALALIHGIVAVIGFLILLVFTFTM